MVAEIIAIGSELLSPYRIDTNSLELTEKLMEMGIRVGGKCVVGDNEEDISRAIRTAASRAQLIIITGGLGPTNDDKTREGISKALKLNLIFKKEIHNQIIEKYRQMKRNAEPPDNLARMAFVPEGAEIIENNVGAAPGLWIEMKEGELYILSLPGPPQEWRPMFEVVREKLSSFGNHFFSRRSLRIAGLREAEVEEKISPIYTGVKNPSVTILSSAEDIQIQIWGKAKEKQEAERLAEEMKESFLNVLEDNVYSLKDEPLEKVVGELLRKKEKTLAVAESCTGGLLSHRITNVPKSSDYFLFSGVVYSNEAKIKVLGVNEKDIKEHGAVSEEIATQMAEGVRKTAGADFGIGITGIAGPGGGTKEKPVGLVYISLSWEGGAETKRFRFPGTRLQVKTYATSHALNMLRKRLL